MTADERVTAHYATLLGPHLTWMLGNDIETTAADQGALLAELLGDTPIRGTALDLGCGSGAQTLALADRGHDTVIAVDPDPGLLAELRGHAVARPAVRTVENDALDALRGLEDTTVTVAVCMGDSLVHLGSHAAVDVLFAELARVVVGGGAVVLTYRDMTAHLTGTERFVPVRADAERILTCFLDHHPDPERDAAAETVEVHDVLHLRDGERWRMLCHSYPKLRLAHDRVADGLREAGFEVTTHVLGSNGMWCTAARRPA